jgi:hypothetical protein
MPGLKPRPGFDWSRVRWDKADDFVSMRCSYCDYVIDEEVDPIPLRMWDDHSNSAVFCEGCMQKWWGFEPLPEE